MEEWRGKKINEEAKTDGWGDAGRDGRWMKAGRMRVPEVAMGASQRAKHLGSASFSLLINTDAETTDMCRRFAKMSTRSKTLSH